MRPFRLPALPWDLPEDPLPAVAPIGSDPMALIPLPIAPAAEPSAAQDDGVVMVDLVGEVEAHAKVTGTAVLSAAVASTAALRTSYTSGAAGAYNITVNFSGSWTASLQDVFVAAANRISAVIVGDVPNVRVGTVAVDDIVITASLRAIDGVGGILGQAGPTALRAGNGFIGRNAVAEYNKLVDGYAAGHRGSTVLPNGTKLAKGAVPIETLGGAGTARVHWSEAVFDSEMMTGWLDTAPKGGMVAAPLSAITAASLKDLGCVVAARPPTDFYILG